MFLLFLFVFAYQFHVFFSRSLFIRQIHNHPICAFSQVQCKWLVSHPPHCPTEIWQIYTSILSLTPWKTIQYVWAVYTYIGPTRLPGFTTVLKKGPFINLHDFHWQTVFRQDPKYLYVHICTPSIHGTSIFTYMKTIKINQMLVNIDTIIYLGNL